MNLLQRGHQPIRTAARQIGLRNPAGGNSQTTGSDGPRARHIALRVPDDQHPIAGDPRSERLLRSLMGDGSNDVPILVVVAESPNREFFPQPMGPKLQFGSQAHVSRQEPDQGGRREGTTGLEERTDARAGLPRMGTQLLGKQEKIRLQKTLPIRWAHLESMEFEVFPDERGIGPPMKVHVIGPSLDPKNQLGSAGKSLHPGTARADQGSIDIEQNHVHDQGGHAAPSGLWPQRWPSP